MILETKWSTSRARNSYGYPVCSLYADDRLVARCNGGGYDMVGTVVGSWAETAFADRLRKLAPADMPEQSHWEPERKPGRACHNETCTHSRDRLLSRLVAGEIPDAADSLCVIPAGRHERHADPQPCPHCGASTVAERGAGRTVSDGRGLYGLTFHDPDYRASRAVIGTDTSDRTLAPGGSIGQTVEEAEKACVSFGLERLQAQYRASSPHATERHTIPRIDGACDMSRVEAILRAVGIVLQDITPRTRRRGRQGSTWSVIDNGSAA